MGWIGTVLAVFIASAVEVVEVVTIALALGVTRGWRSTLAGMGVATVILVAVTAVLGTALQRFDIHLLEILIGSLLLVFGLQWLRKAILRSSGYKALNDEDQIFQEEVAAAQAAPQVKRFSLDWFAFTVAFKGMFLEGLEIIFIVMTIGTSSGRMGVAATAAVVAAVLVGLVAVILRHPLSKVPENTLKFAVGLMLVTFGTYWAGGGVGVQWFGSDLALFWILGVYGLFSFLSVRYLRSVHPDARAMPASVS